MLLLVRSALRRHRRSLIVVTLLVAVSGAVVLGAAAGARRTATSLERFRAYSHAADLELDLESATPAQLARFERVPGVAGVGRLRQVMIAGPGGGFLPTAAAVDGSFGTVVDRPRVVRGRLPDPAKVRELAIGESFGSRLHLRVGDRARFASYSPAQIALGASGTDPGRPAGPRVRFRVVGIVRRPLDLGVSGAFGGVIVPTPAFNARYADTIGGFVPVLLRVRTDDGAAQVPEVVRAARRIFGDALFQTLGVGAETEGARNAIDVLTAALWIFAAVAALAGATAVAIVVTRQVAAGADDQAVLAALGCTTTQRAFAVGAFAIPTALVGGTLAVLAAAITSPLLPFGLARRAEVDPGLHVDVLVLGAGVVAVGAFVVVVGAVASWRVARRIGLDREAQPRRRPSRAPAAVARSGAPAALTTGTQFALPGRGGGAATTRSAVIGAAFGTLGISAVIVFGASLHRLLTTPTRYGWTWDAVVEPTTAAPATGSSGACNDVSTEMAHDRAVSALGAICFEAVAVNGRPMTAWGFGSLRGRIEPAVVRGRAPRGPDEIALGAAAMDAAGADLGDRVRVRGGTGTYRFRVVGQVLLPALTLDSPEPLAGGAAITDADFTRLFPEEAAPNRTFVARFAPDADRHGLVRTRRGELRFATGAGTPSTVPVEVARLRQVRALPLVLGALLGVLATVAVAQAIGATVRRHRRDLAVLRTVGFRRRDVRATIAWQTTIVAVLGLLIGIPAGVAVGRVVWRAVADGVGVSTSAATPALLLVATALGALVVTNLVGAGAASRALHDKPAATLTAE